MPNFTRRLITKEGPDFYPTPRWGTEALLKHINFNGVILEPCCGDGAMAEVLKEKTNCEVISSDLYDRGYGEKRDFLSYKNSIDNIVTNPPFNIAEDLLLHAFKLYEKKICFLLRAAFLESSRRYNNIFSINPPAKVLIFSERLSLYPKGTEVNGGGTTSYAWFVWDREDSSKETKIEWIKPGSKEKNINGSIKVLDLAELGL